MRLNSCLQISIVIFPKNMQSVPIASAANGKPQKNSKLQREFNRSHGRLSYSFLGFIFACLNPVSIPVLDGFAKEVFDCHEIKRKGTMSEKMVTCRCQHCDCHIEFDASGFQEGSMAPVKCPDCQKVTEIFIPQLKPKEMSMPKPPIKFSTKGLISAIYKETSTQKYERFIFTMIRLFGVFCATLILLALLFLTLGFISTFFQTKAATTNTNESSNDLISKIVNSEYLQEHLREFVIFFSGAYLLLTMLTFVSIVLVLISIERNTRKNEKAD